MTTQYSPNLDWSPVESFGGGFGGGGYGFSGGGFGARTNDPIPVDTDAVRVGVKRLETTEEALENAHSALSTLRDHGDTESEAIEKIEGKIGQVIDKVNKVAMRYDATGKALLTYVVKVEKLQADAVAALEKARAAQQEYRNAQSAADNARPNMGDWMRDPEQYNVDMHQANAHQESANAAEADRRAAAATVQALVAEYQQAASDCREAIEDAIDDGLNDSFWDKVSGFVGDIVGAAISVAKKVINWIKENWEAILDWVAIILTVVGFILIFTGVGAPLGAALMTAGRVLAAALAIKSLAKGIFKLVKSGGKDGWGDLFGAAVGFFGGRALGKGLKALGGSGVGKWAIAFASRQGQGLATKFGQGVVKGPLTTAGSKFASHVGNRLGAASLLWGKNGVPTFNKAVDDLKSAAAGAGWTVAQGSTHVDDLVRRLVRG